VHPGAAWWCVLGWSFLRQGRVVQHRVSSTARGHWEPIVKLVGARGAALKSDYGGGSMRRLFLTVLMILSLGVAANSQTFRGTINGAVTDPSGAAVPNATVKATEIATGIDHTTVTTSDGRFAFQDVPLGFYKVAVTASGFPTNTVDKVEVVAGQIYTLEVQLKLSQTTTTVEVSAAALTLDTTTQTQTMTIPDDVVQNIPLNGRDFTQLISVEPGFGGYNVGGFGSLNGTRPNQINWQIDGVDNNDFWHNIPAVNQGGVSGIAGVVLPIDSVTEFSAQTSSGPEGGRNAGGTVNVVTKSGTNEIHGSVYYYWRNEYFASPSPFFTPCTLGAAACLASGQLTKAPRERNENYGLSAGGPIIKNKTFIFASYEKQDFVFGLSGLATEPSAPWVANAGALLANAGKAFGTYSPVPVSLASCNVLGALTGQLPPGQIPSGCQTGGKGFWPTSGSNSILNLPATTSNFFSPSAEFGYSYNGVARLDQQISDKHHLYLRAYMGQGNQVAPLGGSPALGTASSNLSYYFEVAPIHVYNYSAVLNSTLTSKLTNQLLFGANYFNQIFNDNNNSFVTKSLGLFLSPDATINGKPINGAPNIRIGKFEQIGLTPPEGRSDLTWQITDIISHTVGAHQFRYGAEVRRAKLNEFYHRRGTGRFTFDGTQGPWSGSSTCVSNPNLCALADFLAGDVSFSTIAVGNPERFVHVNAFNAYFQDSWQITKRLNLNYGLRYEYFGPMQSDLKDIANFLPGRGFVVQGVNGVSLFNPGKNHFAPRLGIAYQPTGRSDLVVRAGFGVFFDQINLNPFLDFRPPITASQGIEGNPFGAFPVSTYGANRLGQVSYQWDAVQAGGNPIFPGVRACSDPNCAAATDPKGLSAYSVSPNSRVPYFYNYNLQVEKAFGNAVVWQIGYVGSEGRKLNLVSNINQPNPVTGAIPYPNFGNILQLNTIGTSNYNALQTILRLRAWHGLSSQLAYTWSHALDEISEYRATVVDDNYNPRRDYGNSDFDTRHLFTIDFTYSVPKAPWATSGWSKRVFNDWQVSSVMNWHSGQPYDEILSYLNVVGDPFASGNGVTIDHKFVPAVGTLWVNPTAFCDPNAINPATKLPDPVCRSVSASPYGNISRNKWHAPGYGDVDLSFIKNIPITERVKLQLRADFFNLLNRINLSSGVGALSAFGSASPSGDVCSMNFTTHRCSADFNTTTFGLVTDTIGDFNGAPAIGPGEARNIQLVAKIVF
jgi:Carboxypeptidase regulatory-like domain/TonB dependent receptor